MTGHTRGARYRSGIVISVLWSAAGSLAAAGPTASAAKAQDVAAAAVVAAPDSTPAIASERPWPRTVHSGGTTLIVASPQVDAWDGFSLSARVAVEARRGDGDAAYGVVTIDARTLTDRGTRLVAVHGAHASAARFPGVSGKEASRWAAAIALDLARPDRLIALDRLESSLAASALTVSGSQSLDTVPPRIIVNRVPAVLVTIDGAPEYRATGATGLHRVVNSRALILRAARGQHYLRILGGWMRAPDLDGPWVVAHPSGALAADLDTALAHAIAAREVDELPGGVTPPVRTTPAIGRRAPIIHVATHPTELIVTDGAPNWTPVPGVRVFYMLNTTARVLKSGEDFHIYALIAGRWFRARTLRGPWTYIRADALPRDFARIPNSSPIENVKASVAGTTQARQAAVATTIAQTTALSASGVRFTPRFDGPPSFRPIDSTGLAYVVNSAMPIIRVGGEHGPVYAVENGVWFRASSTDGPWSIATSVPDEIDAIPATSPVYPVRFVHVYATAGDTVFVGYTAGYLGAYVDPTSGVVVAGTGHRYRSWIDHEWFGAPITYGLGANLTFTPWTGWRVAYGFGWTWRDPVTAGGWGLGAYPWWEPWGWGWSYGPSVYPWRPAWTVPESATAEVVTPTPGGWAAYSGDIYRRRWRNRGELRGVAPGAVAWTAHAWAARVGLSYNSHTGIATSGQHGAIENVLEGLAMRPRDVAVTPNGALVAARNDGFGLRATDSVVRIRAGEGSDARRTIPEAYRNGRITASVGVTHASEGEVARADDALYAGPDGVVYRRRHRAWERHDAGGWHVVDTVPATLDRAYRMRMIGDQHVRLLRDAGTTLSSPFDRDRAGPRP